MTPGIAVPRLKTEKAKRAAQHAKGPREKCRTEAGTHIPIVDRNACEGKRDCVEVCPYGVFEVRQIDDRDFSRLSFLGKLKSRMHGKLTAYTPEANLCQACGLCVVACPEDAITLVSQRDWLGMAAV
jgi:NAD-dependent dihydropyrimidine dehydrogenase PreA subunit